MARWLYMIHSNCADPARETEFNQWYDQVHIPDVLTTPGFLRAWRFENHKPGPGEGKFVAAYEIESDDIDSTLAVLMADVAQRRAQGRSSPLLKVTGRNLYRLTSPAQSRAK